MQASVHTVPTVHKQSKTNKQTNKQTKNTHIHTLACIPTYYTGQVTYTTYLPTKPYTIYQHIQPSALKSPQLTYLTHWWYLEQGDWLKS